MLKYILASLVVFTVFVAQAQRRGTPPAEASISVLKRYALDTLPTNHPSTKIVTFSNNTWKYLQTDTADIAVYRGFRTNWDTSHVFAYRNVELTDIPEVVNLKLLSGNKGASFHSPTVGKILSRYGPRGRRNHNGVDIPLTQGEPLYATFDGKVRYAKYNTGGFGYLVIIRHTNGLESWYGHLSKLNVDPDDYVRAGQIIGFSGNTGRSRGPHLHFEMRYCDQTFDPDFIVDFEDGKLRTENFALKRNYFNIHSRASEILDEEYEDEVAEGGGLVAIGSDVTDAIITPKPKLKPKPVAPKSVYHTVKSGDMLSKLAMRYGVSVDQICRLNNIKRTTTLQLNKRLRIK